MNRILIVRLGSLGDIVHALPAAAALRGAFPAARLDWLVDSRQQDLLRLVPILDGLTVLPAGGPITAVLGTVRQLRALRYDVAIDLQGLLKSAILARASGAQRVAGFARHQLREPMASVFYTETSACKGATHVIEKNLALVRSVGAASGEWSFPLEVPASSVPCAVRAALGLTTGGRFAILNPGAAWPNKRWPPARFGALARHLAGRHDLPVVVLWGPEEEALGQEVVASAHGSAVLAPATTIRDLVALLDNAALVVSGDTGPLHIACALGTPAVGIYGPTNPARNGPWSAHDASISRFAGCGCHHLRRCRRERWCLDEIGVDEVTALVDRRLARVPSHA